MKFTHLILAVFLLTQSLQAAHAQLSVEDFPELAPTDFSYVSQERRDIFNDEALRGR